MYPAQESPDALGIKVTADDYVVCVLVNVLEGTGVEMLRTRIKHGVVEFDGMVNNGGGKTVESPADEPQGK